MKLFFGLLVLALVSNECKQTSQQSNLSQEGLIITYEASARRFYEKTWITKDSISYSTDRSLKEIAVSKCNNEDWDELVTLLNAVSIKTLPQLEPPSSRNQVDAAAMATLTVEINNESYKTKVFDHRNPPKDISELVNKVLSMKEMMTKQ